MSAVHSDHTEICRLAVLGDLEWEKTKWVSKCILDQYAAAYEPITEDSYRRLVQIDGQTCIVEVSDTTGRTLKEDHSSAELSIKNADAFILVYSVGSRWSLSRIRLYHALIACVRGSAFPAMIFGTRSDDNLREVYSQQVIRLADSLGCSFAADLLDDGGNPLPDIIRYVRSWKLKKAGSGVGREAIPRHHSSSLMPSRGYKTFLLAELAGTGHVEVERAQSALDRQLVWASHAGDYALVESLLKRGADPNTAIANELAEPALYVAASQGHEGIVSLLLDSGADVSAQGPLDMTALQIASARGHTTIIQLLLSNHEAEINQITPYGTALIAAAAWSHEGTVRWLLDHGANVNAQAGHYNNALYAAVVQGNPLLVRMLVDAGADVTVVAADGSSALQTSVQREFASITQLLLKSEERHRGSVRPLNRSLEVMRPKSDQAVEKIAEENAIPRNVSPYPSSTNAEWSHPHQLSPSGTTVEWGKKNRGNLTKVDRDIAATHGEFYQLPNRSAQEKQDSFTAQSNNATESFLLSASESASLVASYQTVWPTEKSAQRKGPSTTPGLSENIASTLATRPSARTAGEDIRLAPLEFLRYRDEPMVRPWRPKDETLPEHALDNHSREIQQQDSKTFRSNVEVRAITRVRSEESKEKVAVPDHIASHLPMRTATPSEDPHAMNCYTVPNSPTAETPAALRDIDDLTLAADRVQIVRHYEYQRKEEVPFKAMRNLGRGAFGFVEQVETIPRVGQVREIFARKLITLPPFREDISELIKNEVNIVKRLSHHHIIQVISTYSARRDFGIIMAPIADMNLEEYFEQAEHPSESDNLYRWFGCLAAGLAYIHRERVKHRDIKPANILVKGDTVLYTDFGIARDVWDEVTTSTTGSVDAKSPMYCAPEVAAEERRGRRSDVFSLGCIYLEMITVLMWKYDVSLEKLHQHKATGGKRAYYANIDKTLQWMFQLYYRLCDTAEENRTGKSCLVPLDWCIGMLQPDAKDRVYAEALLGRVKNEDLQRPMHERPMTWSGFCCVDVKRDSYKKENTVLQGAWGHFWVWPDSADELWREKSGQWNWQKANEVLHFSLEHDTGSRFTYGG